MSNFASRHIGPRSADVDAMLAALGVPSLDVLLDEVVPSSIRDRAPLALAAGLSESEALDALRTRAERNNALTPMIGQGYYGTFTPPVIQRNILENPAWYTAYTPYQPEISQGRLEALLNFQTTVADLTALDIAGASLLDEATAAAEAMTLARRHSKQKSATFLVDADCHPQVIDVLRDRAEPLGIEVRVLDRAANGPTFEQSLAVDAAFGVLLAWPGSSGALRDPRAIVAAAHAVGAVVCATTDLLACTIVEPPGDWGADVAVGSAQRFGVPLGFGGPHAGFIAVRSGMERTLPGRLVGVSVDAHGRPAFRLALQTREQHIRREKATSNICTAQVLLAVMAATYAVWHGPEGLAAIASQVHAHAQTVADALRAAGVAIGTEPFFDTVIATLPGQAGKIVADARNAGVALRRINDDTVGISCDETTTAAHVDIVLSSFSVDRATISETKTTHRPWARTSAYLTHPVFHRHRSETEMMRYLRRLSDKDLALDRTMIPLGSCTMKLNAAAEMAPVTWPSLSNLHPFADPADTAGSRQMIDELEAMLAACTGYDAVSVQPNAGSQGELAGLLAIRRYHFSRGDNARDVCLIPASAHGTNAASAVMAGMRVVVVACKHEPGESGEIDIDDLKAKLAENLGKVSALMVTYPSTHGVFEERITEICDLVHAAGGQVYTDGANLNALVGVAAPGAFGSDVSHLNLHKTFCIPHGGGGPGVGPVCVKAHLAPYLPGRPDGPAISAAPYGSAGILPIPWMYITMMGAEGLRAATAHAILAANYVAHRLHPYFPVLYRGERGRVAHECILDVRPVAKTTGLSADDVAKRLVDYGFHAPTLSFPVAGTLMVEPTESESLEELDRFCDAMIAIRREMDEHPDAVRNAPHTIAEVTADDWTQPYPRSLAHPTHNPYWPPVSRIDQAYGDRNLMCACPPIEAYS